MRDSNIDRLIAEKVMGWTYSNGDYYRVIYSDAGNRLGSQFICDETEFTPSKMIAHAWRVVKEMERRNFRFDMSTHPDKNYTSVGFELTESEYDLFYTEVEDKKVELAICKCSLDAIAELNRQMEVE